MDFRISPNKRNIVRCNFRRLAHDIRSLDKKMSDLKIESRPFLQVKMTRYVDRGFPGWVACQFADANGQQHHVHEKLPVVSAQHTDPADADFPLNATIACEIEKEWQDGTQRDLVSINTERPLSIKSLEGQTRFIVLSSQVLR